MLKVKCTSIIIIFLVPILLFAGWEPKEVPLMSKWAQKVNPDSVLNKYPRPQLERKEWKNLNGLWEFEFVKGNNDVPWNRALSDSILVPFPVESALSGIKKEATSKLVWYKKEFTLSDNWLTDKLLLHFEAVDWQAEVYINNHKLGIHKGGYDSFTYDITNYVNRYNNKLIVKVFDPSNEGNQPVGKQNNNPHEIWFTPASGIWQTVWLEKVPDIYIDSIFFAPDIDNEMINLDITLNKESNNIVKATIFDNTEKVAENQRYGQGTIQIPIDDPKLWTPSDPHLYDLKLTVNNLDTKNDTVASYFGMRKIEVKTDNRGKPRIYFNNKPQFQMGVLDQGYWPAGIYTAPSDEALKYDIEYVKKLGLNMIRKHIKVEPDRWYYWCDKKGILVWQDMPNAWNPDENQFEVELREMIREHYNSPSIVTWVIFNEGWGIFDVERLTNFVRSLDPTRIINSHSGWNLIDYDHGFGDINDIHNYPPPKMPEIKDDRASVCGEFGGLWRLIEGHTWGEYDPDAGYQNTGSITDNYTSVFMDSIASFKSRGMSAAIYTEITDVMTEYAGYLTYDRKVEKFYPQVIKLKHNKLTSSNSEVNQEGTKPIKINLKQNFPNPFNSKTTIEYCIPYKTNLKLTVYDLLGNKVKTLVKKSHKPGNYSVVFSPEHLSSGIYLYKLNASSYNKIKKMVHIK